MNKIFLTHFDQLAKQMAAQLAANTNNPTNQCPARGHTHGSSQATWLACSEEGGEDHHSTCCAKQRDPPTAMEPAPSLDEEIKDPGCFNLWGHTLGKTKKYHQDLISKCQQINSQN